MGRASKECGHANKCITTTWGILIDRSILLSSVLLILVTGLSYSVNYIFNTIFEQHHRDRFNILLGKEVDLKGFGYNIHQSEIAIGSGGWFGKGFLEGTQTKGGFVPEQHTDYIKKFHTQDQTELINFTILI